MWNGNENEEGLKEGFEKGEVIEGIRGNGGEFVGMQRTREIEWERCGCEMMIEREVKSGQTGESIENTRREGGDGVGVKMNEMKWGWKGI